MLLFTRDEQDECLDSLRTNLSDDTSGILPINSPSTHFVREDTATVFSNASSHWARCLPLGFLLLASLVAFIFIKAAMFNMMMRNFGNVSMLVPGWCDLSHNRPSNFRNQMDAFVWLLVSCSKDEGFFEVAENVSESKTRRSSNFWAKHLTLTPLSVRVVTERTRCVPSSITSSTCVEANWRVDCTRNSMMDISPLTR